MSYFPQLHTNENKTEAELDLSNYAINSDLKNAIGVDTSQFAKKDDLVNLKSEIDKLDIGKLGTAPADLSKLSNAVENDVVKKTECNEFEFDLVKNSLL